MEGLLKKFLEHMDLNKNGKPDVEEAHALFDKVLPPVAEFVKHGGLIAIKHAISPMLSKEALAALDQLIALVPELAH